MPYDTRYGAVQVSLETAVAARFRILAVIVVAILALFRLAHLRVLWADEDYHMAAAIDLLHGLIPYKNFWYDKPPGAALYYLLIGGFPGWPLRVLDAAYVFVAAALLYRLARGLWGEREGMTAAVLLAFFMTFYLPSAVIPFAADALMIVPHIAAVYCAANRKPLLAGLWAGVAFVVNAKAVFVFATCAVWVFPAIVPLTAGFALLPILTAALTIAAGAWPSYLAEVWQWGFAYAAGSPELHPFRNGLLRTVNWSLFHAALVLGAVTTFLRRDHHAFRLGAWLLFSFAGVAMGMRFEPRYFLQLLPPLTVIASRGLILLWHRYGPRVNFACSILLLAPVLRFGPHYVMMGADAATGRTPHWTDLLIDQDSASIAGKLKRLAHPGDTLFVWGYRPDIYVYTRMLPAGRFWDSQPLTGVPADRHLHASGPIIAAVAAAANRRELAHSQPLFVVDALSLYNPVLRIDRYPELRPWLALYREVDRTQTSIIYERTR